MRRYASLFAILFAAIALGVTLLTVTAHAGSVTPTTTLADTPWGGDTVHP